MTKENPIFAVEDTFDPQEQTAAAIEEIKRVRQKGKSPGAAVAEYMLDESSLAFGRLGERVTRDSDLELSIAIHRLIALLYYGLPPLAFLDAEEVVRSGEPSTTQGLEEREGLSSFLVNASLGFTPPQLQRPAEVVAAEAQSYLRKIRSGDILRSTGSPTQITERAGHYVLRQLEIAVNRAIQEGNEAQKLNLVVAALSTAHSMNRFGRLYNALTRPISD